MERRTFVKGAFGLAVLAAGAGLGVVGVQRARNAYYVTPAVDDVAKAKGPVMQAGIELVEQDGAVLGRYDGQDLFKVDPTGASLIELADGTRSLDAIASEVAAGGTVVEPADVAAFFIELCESGFTQNTVLVNLYEITA